MLHFLRDIIIIAKHIFKSPSAALGCGARFAFEVITMLKACSYCGRIHDRHTVCQQKAAAISRRQHKSNDKITRFRNSPSWKYARRQALTRDLNLCRVCLDDGYINSNDIQVHHIVPMCEDFSKRDVVENLICLCPFHHEQAEAGTISRAELSGLAGTPPGGQGES